MQDSLRDLKTQKRPLEDLGVKHFSGSQGNNQYCPVCQSGDHFSVSQKDGIWFWKCHNPKGSARDGGTVIDLYAEIMGIDDKEACRQLADQYLEGNSRNYDLNERTMDEFDPPTLPRTCDTDVAPPKTIWYQKKGSNDERESVNMYADGKNLTFSDATYKDVEVVTYDRDVYAICICRWDHEDGKTIRPCWWSEDDEMWRPGFPPLDNIKRPLFNLDELQSSKDKPVLVVEGEKCLHYLEEALTKAWFDNPEFGEYIVTTNMGGSNAVKKTDWVPLQGRDVTIMPDVDEPGEKFVKNVLAKIGQQARVCWVYDKPNPMPEGGGDDIADYVAEGGSLDKILQDTTVEEPPEHEPDLHEVPDHLKRKSDVYLSGILYRMLNRKKDVPAAHDMGKMWEYDRKLGVWAEIPEMRIKKSIQAFDGRVYGTGDDPKVIGISDSKSKGVYNQLKVQPPMDFNEGFFEDERIGIAFTNGFVTIDNNNLRLMDHSPAHRARHGFEFDYDPEAEAPRFERFLEELFWEDADSDEKIQLLQEFIGAGLFGFAVERDQVLFMHGTGQDGKSQVIKIIDSVMPDRAVSNVTPQKMSDEKHRVNLVDARFNLVTEMPASQVLDSEPFKAITTGDPISARDVYKSTMTFRPTAAHIFAANSTPKVQDVSHGFWRRWIKINFNRKFVENPDPDKNQGKRERGVAERIIRDEKEGVIAWMIEGAKRTFKRGHYEIPRSCEEALKEWRVGANPLSKWMYDNTTDGGWTKSSDLYHDYVNWCNKGNHKPMTVTSFGTTIKEEIGLDRKRRSDGNYYEISLV